MPFSLCGALEWTPYELMDCFVSDIERKLLGLIRSMTEQQKKGLLFIKRSKEMKENNNYASRGNGLPPV